MKVLYATDGGTPAAQALDLFVRAADPSKVEVIVVTVGSDPLPSEAPPPAPNFTEDAVRVLQAAGIAAEARILEGRPAPAILTELDSGDYELAVLGAGNRSWLGRLLLGSVSTKVLHAAPTSVLIVHQASDMQSPVEVLFGTDGSSHAERALTQMASLLDPAACAVTVLSIAEYQIPLVLAPAPRPAYVINPPTPEEQQQWLAPAKALANTAAGRLEAAGFKAEGDAVLGRGTAIRLLAEVEKRGSDLVVVGERGVGAIARVVLGSVSNHVARSAPATLIAR